MPEKDYGPIYAPGQTEMTEGSVWTNPQILPYTAKDKALRAYVKLMKILGWGDLGLDPTAGMMTPVAGVVTRGVKQARRAAVAARGGVPEKPVVPSKNVVEALWRKLAFSPDKPIPQVRAQAEQVPYPVTQGTRGALFSTPRQILRDPKSTIYARGGGGQSAEGGQNILEFERRPKNPLKILRQIGDRGDRSIGYETIRRLGGEKLAEQAQASRFREILRILSNENFDWSIKHLSKSDPELAAAATAVRPYISRREAQKFMDPDLDISRHPREYLASKLARRHGIGDIFALREIGKPGSPRQIYEAPKVSKSLGPTTKRALELYHKYKNTYSSIEHSPKKDWLLTDKPTGVFGKFSRQIAELPSDKFLTLSDSQKLKYLENRSISNKKFDKFYDNLVKRLVEYEKQFPEFNKSFTLASSSLSYPTYDLVRSLRRAEKRGVDPLRELFRRAEQAKQPSYEIERLVNRFIPHLFSMDAEEAHLYQILKALKNSTYGEPDYESALTEFLKRQNLSSSRTPPPSRRWTPTQIMITDPEVVHRNLRKFLEEQKARALAKSQDPDFEDLP